MVPRNGPPQVIDSSEEWLALADVTNGINTRDVWVNHFAAWAGDTESAAASAGTRHFQPIAADFLNRRRIELRRDRERLLEWFEARSREIIGDRGQLAVQIDFLARRSANATQPATANWAGISDPLERLAGFASDGQQPISLRHEAQTLLTLLKKRREDLDAREALRESTVTTLGMLMLVPRSIVQPRR
jgi:hypothetical protein